MAERARAVLVGVGDYAYLDADLAGPKNDVGLMARTLMARGVAAEDITILADPDAAVPDGTVRGLPDRAPILAALDTAIAASARGDTLIFYFSGHGAQAPDLSGDEGGGLDEIFLPRDTRGWNGGVGAVENAILDDELSLVAEAAAARGVRLIGIIDACHSGTGFRALGETPDARARYIAPAQLGLPDAVGERGAAAPPPPGDYVFLYAAQSDQRAFEYPVGEDRVWHGDFTRALTTVMAEVPDLTWAGLVEAAQAQMRQSNGQAAQTPDLEGPLIDEAVFGGDAPGLSRIAVDGRTLQAGLIRGITPGTILTLYGPDGAAIGRAEAENVQALSATLTYLEPFPTARVTAAAVAERALDTSVRVAVSAEAADRLAPLGGVDEVALYGEVPLDAADPTHLLIWADDAFALVGPDGILDPAGPGSSLRLGQGATASALGDALALAIGRLRIEVALTQLSQGAGTTVFSLGALAAAPPEVAFARLPGRVRDNGRCAAPSDQATPLDGPVAHCDGLRVDYHNKTGKMQDVSILFLAADNSVTLLSPTRGESNRLPPGERIRHAFLLTGSQAPLHERVIVVSVPAEPGSVRTRLDFRLSAARTAPVASFMTSMADPSPTRALSLGPPGVTLNVVRQDLTILPIPNGD